MKTLHKLITGLSKYIILSSLIKRWRYLGPNSRVCISCSFVFDLGKKNLSSLEFLLFIKLMWRKLDWSDSDLAYLRWKHVAGDFWTGRYLSHLVFDKAEPNQLWKSDFPFFPIFFHFLLLAGEKERHWNTCGGRIGRRGQWENWNICSVKVNCSFRHTRGIGVGDCGSGYEGEMQKGVYVWVQLILSKHGNCVH